MSEYQRQAQSIVDVAQAQADETYRAYQSNLSNTQYTAEWERSESEKQTENARSMIDQIMAAGASAAYVVNKMPDAFAASGYTIPYLNMVATYYYYQSL